MGCAASSDSVRGSRTRKNRQFYSDDDDDVDDTSTVQSFRSATVDRHRSRKRRAEVRERYEALYGSKCAAAAAAAGDASSFIEECVDDVSSNTTTTSLVFHSDQVYSRSATQTRTTQSEVSTVVGGAQSRNSDSWDPYQGPQEAHQQDIAMQKRSTVGGEEEVVAAPCNCIPGDSPHSQCSKSPNGSSVNLSSTEMPLSKSRQMVIANAFSCAAAPANNSSNEMDDELHNQPSLVVSVVSSDDDDDCSSSCGSGSSPRSASSSPPALLHSPTGSVAISCLSDQQQLDCAMQRIHSVSSSVVLHPPSTPSSKLHPVFVEAIEIAPEDVASFHHELMLEQMNVVVPGTNEVHHMTVAEEAVEKERREELKDQLYHIRKYGVRGFKVPKYSKRPWPRYGAPTQQRGPASKVGGVLTLSCLPSMASTPLHSVGNSPRGGGGGGGGDAGALSVGAENPPSLLPPPDPSSPFSPQQLAGGGNFCTTEDVVGLEPGAPMGMGDEATQDSGLPKQREAEGEPLPPHPFAVNATDNEEGKVVVRTPPSLRPHSPTTPSSPVASFRSLHSTRSSSPLIPAITSSASTAGSVLAGQPPPIVSIVAHSGKYGGVWKERKRPVAAMNFNNVEFNGEGSGSLSFDRLFYNTNSSSPSSLAGSPIRSHPPSFDVLLRQQQQGHPMQERQHQQSLGGCVSSGNSSRAPSPVSRSIEDSGNGVRYLPCPPSPTTGTPPAQRATLPLPSPLAGSVALPQIYTQHLEGAIGTTSTTPPSLPDVPDRLQTSNESASSFLPSYSLSVSGRDSSALQKVAHSSTQYSSQQHEHDAPMCAGSLCGSGSSGNANSTTLSEAQLSGIHFVASPTSTPPPTPTAVTVVPVRLMKETEMERSSSGVHSAHLAISRRRKSGW